jgi:hypothetical protein
MDFLYSAFRIQGTGAFMDDKISIFFLYRPYRVMSLNNLDALARETGRQLKLKYPMKYLDEINNSEKNESLP